MLQKYIKLLIILIVFSQSSFAQRIPSDFAVLISAKTDTTAGYRIILNWKIDTSAYFVSIYKKTKDEPNFQKQLAKLSKNDSTFIDIDVQKGIGYEYCIIKTDSIDYGYGYIYAGKDLPLVEQRGYALVLADYNSAAGLADELRQFELDLIGDGWQVKTVAVPRAERFNPKSVHIVKEIIKREYKNSNGKLSQVILVGRTPVPYSGNYAIDGHIPEHYGAWASDLYYGELDGEWSDYEANTEVAERDATRNIPYDGKWDQTYFPTELELTVGRIDMYNLPVFKESELDLLKNYFKKNHEWRHGKIQVRQRALLHDNFRMNWGEPFAATAWMNFAALVGLQNIDTLNMRTDLSKYTFLFSYGCGSGSYNSCYNVAYSDEFATKPRRSVFSMFFGSWNGDFDTEDNLLRSAIASSPSILTSCWPGRPNWFFHHMGLGETIGYSTILSQNNLNNYPSNATDGRHLTHIALMGDPTLRMHPVAPPIGITLDTIRIDGSLHTKILWEASPDNEIIGYNIYGADNLYGEFKKLNSGLVTGLSFIDTGSSMISDVYQVRAVKLQHSQSGTYYNQSQGVFAEKYHGELRLIKLSNAKYDFKILVNPTINILKLLISDPFEASAQISIFDNLGNYAAAPFYVQTSKGEKIFEFDLRELLQDKFKSGIYYVKFESGAYSIIVKLLIVI